jgi:hypothetical protein
MSLGFTTGEALHEERKLHGAVAELENAGDEAGRTLLELARGLVGGEGEKDG